MARHKITKVVVQYENGQTDEWEGEGYLDDVSTTQTQERWANHTDKEPKLSVKPVRYISIVMPRV